MMNRKNRALSQNKQVYLNRDDRVVLISLQKYAFSVLVGLCAHLSSFTPAYISHCLIFPFFDRSLARLIVGICVGRINLTAETGQ